MLLNDDFSTLEDYQRELLSILFSKSNGMFGSNKLFKMAKLDAGSASIKKGEQSKLSEIRQALASRAYKTSSLCGKDLISKDYYVKSGFTARNLFFIAGGIFFVLFALLISLNPLVAVSFLISGSIVLMFAFFMSKLSAKGAETLWKIKGFRYYMTVAEKYRQQFNEKENIFERFLPYAIAFGLTKEWIKKIQEIYGQNYFNTYHPVWFAGSVASFDIDSFTDSMNAVSKSVSSASSSGSGGSGGGGGGGGGGGW